MLVNEQLRKRSKIMSSRLLMMKSTTDRFTLDNLRRMVLWAIEQGYDKDSELYFFSNDRLPTREEFDAGGTTVKRMMLSDAD